MVYKVPVNRPTRTDREPSYMHEALGHTKVHWRDGFRRMVEARHPELVLSPPS